MNATHRPAQARGPRRAAAILAAVAVIATTFTAFPTSASGAVTPPDGLTSETAAGSCWEIKQNSPASASGIYWIVTPAFVAPQQFYCDQTTDGGGWALIARGREGWKAQYIGLRSAVTLRNTVTGTGAFLTAQLPGKTVDGLLNNTNVSSLPDGIRVRRATTADGSAWQEVRFAMPDRTRWAWTFEAEHRVGAYKFDANSGSGGTTSGFGLDNGFNRLDTNASQAQGYVGGMAYGANVTGTTSSTTYLYSSTNGGANARPFAQMFVRPKLTLASFDFGTVPSSGTAASTIRAIPESNAITTTWGVSGQGNGVDGELNTEVAAFGQVGDTVYVGGNFRYVQKTQNATGTDRIEQKFIAGFNVNTGDWVSTFRPVLNGQVKSIVGLPDGRLAVGGQFGTANGAPQVGLVVLDPVTGATASGWQVSLENRVSGGTVQVRGLTVQDNRLYLSGSFTHLTAAGKTTAFARNGARINTTTGAPDTNWNPNLNGTSVGLDTPASGDRTYFSGYFKAAGTTPAISAAAVQTAAGAPLVSPGWTPTFSKPGTNYDGNVWQLGVREAGGKVWLGGSEHSLFAYSRDDFSLQAGNIAKNGGDFQAVTSSGNTVFAGCHCGDFVYQNAFTWSSIGSGWTQADKISLFGAWDATTAAYLPEFNPLLQARRGYGVWAIFTDSTGTLWAGGDLDHAVRAGEVNQWVGGFARFPARDTAAPSTPGNAAASASGSTRTLSWAASTDNRAVAGYEVLRENRVIATTTARSFSVPEGDSSVRYFVRATDAAGNRSASSAALVVAPAPAAPVEETLVANGANWKWRYSSTALPSDWNATAFDDSTWATGAAPLGFGAASIATDVSVGATTPKPLSAQYRSAFTVANTSTIASATVSVIADDGAVVYVNGTEVGRANLPASALTQSTYATAAPRSTTATANRVTFTVPAALLADGTNEVAVSSHLNYRSTPDLSFDLKLTVVR